MNRFNNFIEKTTLFLSIIGLITLLISGIGIYNGVNGYLKKKIKNIAIIKSLGAKNNTVFKIYFFQILIIFLTAIIPAIIFSSLLPFILSSIIREYLLVSFEPSIFIKPIILGSLFGIFTSSLFSIVPILKTYNIKASQLIRLSANNSLNDISIKYKVIIFTAIIIILSLLTFMLSNSIKLAIYLLIGIGLSYLILNLSINIFLILIRFIKFPVKSLFEISRKSIIRPGSFSKSIIFSFSIGLSLLISLNVVDESLNFKINNSLNMTAPNYFLLDVQPDQVKNIRKDASEVMDLNNLNLQPMLRGRIIEIKGVKVENININKNVEWVLKSDRAFSWTNTI